MFKKQISAKDQKLSIQDGGGGSALHQRSITRNNAASISPSRNESRVSVRDVMSDNRKRAQLESSINRSRVPLD